MLVDDYRSSSRSRSHRLVHQNFYIKTRWSNAANSHRVLAWRSLSASTLLDAYLWDLRLKGSLLADTASYSHNPRKSITGTLLLNFCSNIIRRLKACIVESAATMMLSVAFRHPAPFVPTQWLGPKHKAIEDQAPCQLHRVKSACSSADEYD